MRASSLADVWPELRQQHLRFLWAEQTTRLGEGDARGGTELETLVYVATAQGIQQQWLQLGLSRAGSASQASPGVIRLAGCRM